MHINIDALVKLIHTHQVQCLWCPCSSPGGHPLSLQPSPQILSATKHKHLSFYCIWLLQYSGTTLPRMLQIFINMWFRDLFHSNLLFKVTLMRGTSVNEDEVKRKKERKKDTQAVFTIVSTVPHPQQQWNGNILLPLTLQVGLRSSPLPLR